MNDNNRLLVKVKDAGIGIPSNHLQNIFNEYLPQAAVQQHENGTGLGLSMAIDISEFPERSNTMVQEILIFLLSD